MKIFQISCRGGQITNRCGISRAGECNTQIRSRRANTPKNSNNSPLPWCQEKLAIYLVLMFALLSVSSAANAEEAEKPVSSGETQKTLEERKAVIDAQKDLITSQKGLLDAQKELIQAKFPAIEGGVDGKLTQGTGSLYEIGAWAKTFERVEKSAKEICARLMPVTAGKNTVLVSDEDVKAASQYLIANNDLADIEREMKTAAEEPAPSAAFALPFVTAAAALTTIADFTKLFRTNRTLFSEKTEIPTEALIDQVSLCLSGTIQYPAVKFLQAVLSPGTSKFWNRINSLDQTRAKLNEIADGTNTAKAAKAKAAANRFDKFVAMLISSNEAAKTPNILYLLRGETVNESGSLNNSVFLMLNIAKQGGFSMTTSSIWREDRLYVSGGVIVSYRLIDRGVLKAAGTLAEVTPELERVSLSAHRSMQHNQSAVGKDW